MIDAMRCLNIFFVAALDGTLCSIIIESERYIYAKGRENSERPIHTNKSNT